MNIVKGAVGLVGTAAIAGWVAYAVSAPRNVENAMNQPMASLGGSSIAEQLEKSKAEARKEQCAKFRDLASQAWDRSLENGTGDGDTTKIDELDRQVARFCD